MDTDMLVFVAYFLQYILLFLDNNLNEKYDQFSNSKSLASGCC